MRFGWLVSIKLRFVMRKKALISFFIIVLINIFTFAQGKISGDVSLNLKDETLLANLKYNFFALKENQSDFKFLLSGDFEIISISCNKCASIDYNTKERSLRVIQFRVKKPLQKGELVNFEIEYGGKLGEMYNKEQQFLEMGLDFFWIPYESQIGEFNYSYRLKIKTDSPDFMMFGNGKTTRKGKDWLIESKTEDFDINVIFGKDLKLKTYNENGYNLEVVSRNMPEEISDGLLKGMIETLGFYNSTFGKKRPQKNVTAVFRPFELELGYFRKGFFILESPKKADELFSSISHELAHFWWSRANQQNDWLDESFAEYSAMLAVRKFRGIERFNANLERKQKQNINLPPIYGFDRTQNRQQTPLVLYVKGPLKLYELEQMLGEEKFLQFMQKLEDEKINETDQLIAALRKFSSNEIADKFLAKLKD